MSFRRTFDPDREYAVIVGALSSERLIFDKTFKFNRRKRLSKEDHELKQRLDARRKAVRKATNEFAELVSKCRHMSASVVNESNALTFFRCDICNSILSQIKTEYVNKEKK